MWNERLPEDVEGRSGWKGEDLQARTVDHNVEKVEKLAGVSNWYHPKEREDERTGSHGRKRDERTEEQRERKEPQRVETVLFVPFTKNSELKKEMQKRWKTQPSGKN